MSRMTGQKTVGQQEAELEFKLDLTESKAWTLKNHADSPSNDHLQRTYNLVGKRD